MPNFFRDILLPQWFHKPRYPTHDFTGETIIVTGANIGLGLEACKHFSRLGAAKIIAAVRNIEKGEAAKAEIERETKRTGVVEVWQLDLSSYDSVKEFASRTSNLARIDIAILNASIATAKYEVVEGNESSITVNVISTALLALLLLPVLRQSASRNNIEPMLNIVGSGIHGWAAFRERDASNIFDALNDEERTNMEERYAVTKLLQVFFFREIAERTKSAKPFVIVNSVTPGLVRTALSRNADGLQKFMLNIMTWLCAWEVEVGSRTLVHAAAVGPESHGIFMSQYAELDNPRALDVNVTGTQGQKDQKRVWEELVAKLEAIQSGVTHGL